MTLKEIQEFCKKNNISPDEEITFKTGNIRNIPLDIKLSSKMIFPTYSDPFTGNRLEMELTPKNIFPQFNYEKQPKT